MALAGCPSDSGGDGTQTGTTVPAGTATDSSPESVGLAESATEALSLAEVGRESVEDSQVVGYRPTGDASTMVGEFATGTGSGPPAGRTVLASRMDIPEVFVPVGDEPEIDGDRVGVFAPAGARDGDVTPSDLLVFVPGSELGDVTVVNDTTRLLGGGETVPDSRWLPDQVWSASEGWAGTTAWIPSSNWVPENTWIADRDWVPNTDPTSARVVVPDTGTGVADGYGESVQEGARLSAEHALVVVPGEAALPDVTWTSETIFDAGLPAGMGPATAGVSVVAGSDDPSSLLTTAPGRRAVSLATTGGADPLEWVADPVRLDRTDHFDPADGPFQRGDGNGGGEMRSYGGIVAGSNGPFAAIAHLLSRESTTVIGADLTPVGSTTQFDDGAYERVFPRSRLHESRGYTWVAASDDRETATPTPTATPTATETETPEPAEGTRLECGSELPGQITEDTVLQRGCTYTVSSNSGPNVKEGARLSIEPGVEIEVQQGTTIAVDDGAISAQGTEDNPIEIYGSDAEPGYWGGILVDTDSPDNELTHVTIADAGGVYWSAALSVNGATIRSCTVRNSSTGGIRVDESGDLVDFRDNTIENVGGPPIKIHANKLGALTGTTTFRNNDQSHVLVGLRGRNSETVTDDATWPAMAIPYECNNGLDVQSSVDIDPGATFQFREGGPYGLFVSEGGQLRADASDGDPITFRGVEETPGSWRGILVRTETDNLLDNVEVRHGGGGYREATVGVGIDSPGSLAVRNSTIAEGASVGFLATDDADIREFRDNAFEDVAGSPIQLHANKLGALTGTSTFQGNDQSHVLVGLRGRNSETVTDDATWPAMAVKYEANNSLDVQASVDIDPGATFQFQQEGPYGLFVSEGGQLRADASGGNPVIFRGVEDTPGFWRGIFVHTEVDNLLRNVVVSDGGGGYRSANIGVGISDPGALTIRNSTVSDSAGWGIIFEDGSFTEENNTFENNASGDVQRPDE